MSEDLTASNVPFTFETQEKETTLKQVTAVENPFSLPEERSAIDQKFHLIQASKPPGNKIEFSGFFTTPLTCFLCSGHLPARTPKDYRKPD